MLSALFLVTISGFTIKSGVDRKSNDFGSNVRDKINSNKVINNNEAVSKFKRNEDKSHESANSDSSEIYFSDQDYYYDDDYNDDEFNNNDNTFDKGEKGGDENEEGNDDDIDDDVSKYAYDYTNDDEISDENHNENKHESELVRVIRKYVYEPSVVKTTHEYYDDSNDKEKYDKQYGAGPDDSEGKTHEDWPLLEDDNGVVVVVDSAQGVRSREQHGNQRCFFGWYLNANGICAPPRNKCEPGLVHNNAGECVGPDNGYWYK